VGYTSAGGEGENDVSSASSDELLANSVVYIGRASFRFGPEREEPSVTARIAKWAPGPDEAAEDEIPDLTHFAVMKRRPEVVLPLWTLGSLGALAFAVGLALVAVWLQ
jgi:hypothetical protein